MIILYLSLIYITHIFFLASIEYLNQAIEYYFRDHRISYAAKLKKTIGEIYEGDGEIPLAIKSYREAADLYEAESDNTRFFFMNFLFFLIFL